MANQLTGRIVFASGKTGDYDLWLLELPSGELTQLTHGQWWNDRPHCSPDGAWIVFTSNEAGPTEIFKMARDGGQKVQLTHGGKWVDSPKFSPDGQQIAYISNEAGTNDVWIMDADGTNRHPVIQHEGSDNHVAWSRDGKSVLWSSDRDEKDADIWRFELATGQITQLTTAFGADITPAPSPDGKLIAFVSNRPLHPETSGRWQDRDKDLWLMRDDGSCQARVTSNQGTDYCPCWSPDGRYVLYVSGKENQSMRLRLLDVADLVAAYEIGDEEQIHRLAARLRSAAVPLDRGPLEAEIGAGRHTTFLTQFLPESWVAPFYPADYFGTERYPDWSAR
jgi:Tol biopolymer transport system component